MVVLTRFLTTEVTLKSGACMLPRLWNIPKPNQNVLQSWKLWEAKYEDENPGVNDDVAAGLWKPSGKNSRPSRTGQNTGHGRMK